MFLEHERNYGLGMDALDAVCSGNTDSWFGHGCSSRRILLEHERNHCLCMDALVGVCSWNTNEIMVWAWMLWSPYALGTRMELWFGVVAWMLWSPSALGTRTELRSGRSLQETAPALKVLGAKLGQGQLHCTDAGLRNVSDMCVSAARRLVGGLNLKA